MAGADPRAGLSRAPIFGPKTKISGLACGPARSRGEGGGRGGFFFAPKLPPTLERT